ncbi:MAG: hypothetical protein A2499_05000 [Stygiobacter sp. RIFOXYC12_FULL_38_8]|nr:MAG: hypothetical protein A2299_16370 [Stygiobacter sp. RIFOXYB2_FULL_37_11]OGV13483.1 MAG: hypothetical protein A2237_17065 [Stygiobacter sp. RIFOXYA2_FULL_38_8]OGV14774.1 MAG: hypothetical protein A2440_09750 [Stygiobacter sp. RIFOXYC2_FULL_38_25]OGV22309.1 MAG: hypothetical protein A2499_05000 [Stygiobacter sp. RIFOXYC12_FULL_38_8]OGV79267.1 MAG: hypothetical protein A2X65_02120 [Stygiobacter sp. GWF2_38_21]
MKKLFILLVLLSVNMTAQKLSANISLHFEGITGDEAYKHMWFLLDKFPDASVGLGLHEPITEEETEYQEDCIEERVNLHKGDLFKAVDPYNKNYGKIYKVWSDYLLPDRWNLRVYVLGTNKNEGGTTLFHVSDIAKCDKYGKIIDGCSEEAYYSKY